MFEAHIAALKINVKVDWSSRHFSQNFNIQVNHGFSCIDVSLVPRGILKTEGANLVVIEGILISQSYMAELLVPVVLQFSVQEPVPVLVRSRIHLAESANFIRTMMCALTGHCVHQTCLQWNMCSTCLDRGFDA